MSWKPLSLGEALSVKHGFAFKGTFFSDRGSYLVLTPGNFREHGGFRLRAGKDRWYTGDFPEEYILDERDIVVAMTEQGPGLLGSSAIVPEGNLYLHNQRLGLVTDLDESVLDRKFTYFLFNTRGVRAQINSSASGTKVRHTSPGRICKVRVRVPCVESQARIADILSAYDDLIENNRRRIALLEQAARELYREWFVRLRFPGHESTRIVDGLPERWERKTLGDVANITMGQSPKSMHYNETGVGLPFHQGVAYFGDRFPADRMYCSLEARVAVPGDILFSVRAPVGRINITLDKIVIGRGIAAIQSVQDQQSFLFYALKNHFFREDMIGGGTIFAAVTKKELHGVHIMQATRNVIQMFTNRIRSVDSQIEGLHLMAEQLIRARDLLLPRLMSGKVAV